ncbi:MAG: hypothetical protein VKJ02_13595 [Snowella sp.]|nr:hypothetical protein [Snowella sp.]
MSKHWIVFLSILPLLTLVSCASSPEEQSTNPTPPPVTASPPPVAPPPAQQPLAGSQGSTQPKASSIDLASQGLIPATDPKKRVQEVQKARNNPFGLIPIKAEIQGNEFNNSSSATSPRASGQSSALPRNQSKKQVKTFESSLKEAKVGRYCSGKNRQKEVVLATAGQGASAKIIPPEVDTRDAKGMKIYGVIEFREGPVAIVQLRNQSVAQSITQRSALQSSSNPSETVFVKSIQGGVDGSLTLEQNGKTITRGIAEEVPPLTPPASGKIEISGGQAPEIIVVQEANTDGFGAVKKNGVTLMLTEARIAFEKLGEKDSAPVYRIHGTICNDSNQDVKVSKISLSVLGEDSEGGAKKVVLDSATPDLTNDNTPYPLEKQGGKGKFDAPLLKLRGEDKKKVYIRLIDWD